MRFRLSKHAKNKLRFYKLHIVPDIINEITRIIVFGKEDVIEQSDGTLVTKGNISGLDLRFYYIVDYNKDEVVVKSLYIKGKIKRKDIK
jgi:hypothetical protein